MDIFVCVGGWGGVGWWWVRAWRLGEGVELEGLSSVGIKKVSEE